MTAAAAALFACPGRVGYPLRRDRRERVKELEESAADKREGGKGVERVPLTHSKCGVNHCSTAFPPSFSNPVTSSIRLFAD